MQKITRWTLVSEGSIVSHRNFADDECRVFFPVVESVWWGCANDRELTISTIYGERRLMTSFLEAFDGEAMDIEEFLDYVRSAPDSHPMPQRHSLTHCLRHVSLALMSHLVVRCCVIAVRANKSDADISAIMEMRVGDILPR